MKTRRIAIMVMGLALAGITGVYGQSKKEKIELLTRKVDSLEKALSAKTESLVQLQIKFARLEGATDAHNEEIKRLETRADSLKGALITSNSIVENQASKIAQLNEDTATLRSQLKEWTSRNAALLSELESAKQKPGDAVTVVKSVKPIDQPKEEPKNTNTATGSKQDQTVKN